MVENLFLKQNSFQDSSLNALISNNKRNWILTGHVIVKLRYDQIYKLKTIQIIITPSTIQQEKASVVSSFEAAKQAGEAAAEAGGVAGLAVAAVTSDVGLKRDQQSPCSVEEDSGPTSADLVMSSTYGKVREWFFSRVFYFVYYFDRYNVGRALFARGSPGTPRWPKIF